MNEEEKRMLKKYTRTCSYINPLLYRLLDEYENTSAYFEIVSTLHERRFNTEFFCDRGDYTDLVENAKRCAYEELPIGESISIYLFDTMILKWEPIV